MSPVTFFFEPSRTIQGKLSLGTHPHKQRLRCGAATKSAFDNSRGCKQRPLSRSSIRGDQSEIMFGVLVVVLGRDPIAGLEFSLGQCNVPVIVSSSIVRALRRWTGRTRYPSPGAASNRWSLLLPIHVCLSAILHGSLLRGGELSLRAAYKNQSWCDESL
jgi:hypothetical protein